MADTGWMSALPHALIARAALRPLRIRGASRAAARFGRRAFRAARRTPPVFQLIVAIVVLAAAWAPVNWMVQVVRKPAELYGAVSGSRAQVPAQTWQQYGFRVRGAFDRRHHGGAARCAGAGGKQRQPGRPDLLALAIQLEPVRRLPAGLQRGRDVPADGWHVRRSAALLRPRSRGRRGRPLERPELRAGSTRSTPGWWPVTPWR